MKSEKSKAITKIDVSNPDFGTICNCAVRYACGRQSYMPSLVIGFMTPLIRQLDNRTLWCFDQDLTEAEIDNNLGDSIIDAPGWRKFHEAVRRERSRRGEGLYKSYRQNG